MHPTENVRMSPVAMTAGKVWQGLERFSQRPDYLLQLIEPVVSSMTVSGVSYKKILESLHLSILLAKNKENNTATDLN